jgi:predicted membrane protein
MDSEPRFLITPRLVVGVGIALLGLILTLDRLHLLDAGRVLRYWPVGLMVVGGLMVAQGGYRGQTLRGIIVFAVGTWMFLYNERLLPAPIWELFWPIILIVVGVSMALRPRGRTLREIRGRVRDRVASNSGAATFGGGAASGAASFNAEDARYRDGAGLAGTYDNTPHISIFSVWSGVRRISNASAFTGADVTAIMGGAKLDLRMARIPAGEEAVIDITAVMGGVEVVVPSTWSVSTPLVPFMGGLEDKRLPPLPVDGKIPVPDAKTPCLVIRGFVMMGGVVLSS